MKNTSVSIKSSPTNRSARQEAPGGQLIGEHSLTIGTSEQVLGTLTFNPVQ